MQKKKSSCLISTCTEFPFFPWWLIKRLAPISSHYEMRPLLPLVLFFIHGHELLIAEWRGRRAKAMLPTASLALKSWGRRNNKDKRLESTRSDAWPWWLCCLCCLHSFYTPLLLIHSEWLILWLNSHLSLFPNPECVTLFRPQDKIIRSGEFIQSSESPPPLFFVAPIVFIFISYRDTWMCRITCANWNNRSLLRQPSPNPRTKCEHREQLPIMLLPSVHLLVWNTQL